MRPVVMLFSLGGADLTETLIDRVTRVTFTDQEGFASDVLEVELDDRGQFVTLPAPGDKIRCLMGYVERDLTTLGDFVVDEVRLSGPPLTIAFTAKGVDLVNTYLKAPLIGYSDDESLDALARRIAARHNLTPVIHPDAQAILIGHIDQQTESDMALLERLARARDWVLRLDAERLTLRPHAAALPPGRQAEDFTPPLHKIDARQLTRYDYTTNARSRYGKVRAWYYDPDTGRRYPVEVSDGGEGPTLDLRHDAKSEADARAAAEGRLRQLRRAEGSLTLELPGDTRLLAGHHVIITGLSDPIAGQWVIERAEHTLDAGGLKTRLECVPPNAPGRAKHDITQSLIEEVE
jgi:hypothetical protein